MSKSDDFASKLSSSASPGLPRVCIPQAALDLLTCREASFLQSARVPTLLIFLTCVFCQASKGILVWDACVWACIIIDATFYISVYFWKKYLCGSKFQKCGAFLVAQWLRICLLMQGTRVQALVWEDPICRGAAGPVSHNYWACASGACAPQQERLR